MQTPIFHFFRSALSTSSRDLLAGTANAAVRRNAVHYLGMSMLLGGVLIVMRWMDQSGVDSGAGLDRGGSLSWTLLTEFGWLSIYVVALGLILLMKPNGVWCVRMTLGVVLLEGAMVMLRWSVGVDPSPGGNALVGILIVLTLGASLMPWSPRQTLGLALIWIVGSTVTLLVVTAGYEFSIGAAVFGYFSVTVPGIMVSFFRTTRVRDKFERDYFQSRYERISQELASAKNIHERAFPRPRTAGDVRFAYSYRPMSQIGGDYLFASALNESVDSPVLIVLLDVSGHGIPAALTVNRLQGELMQMVGENPLIGPAELIAALDRYTCLTSPDQPVLVTGIAACIDPVKNTLRIANAGHPSAILRDRSGNITEIDATGPLMGIDPLMDIEWGEELFPFRAGDALIAFTDGITEAMNAHREMFGMDGVRKVINSQWIEAGQRWPEMVRRSVDRYCEGVVLDDMLIVDVYRP